MSPEQARGHGNLTAQSDQFSFGLVLYTLAAGKRAFQRASTAETMAAIIREDAEPLPPGVPAPLRWVVERLMAKDPAERYDSTRDLYRELRQIRDRLSQTTSAVTSTAPVVSTTTWRRRGLVIGLLAAGCVVAGFVVQSLMPPDTTDLAAYKFTPIAQNEAEERQPSWSPDGKSIAYYADTHGVSQVFTRAVGSREAAQLTNASHNCLNPFWSPDGATIYYNSGFGGWSVPASGGPAELVLENAELGAVHPDGRTMAFARDGKLWTVSLKGGQAKEFWPGPLRADFPSWQFSPDGSALAVESDGDYWILPYPSGAPRKLYSGRGHVASVGASWFPDSRRLVVAEDYGESTSALVQIDVRDGSRRTIYSSPSNLQFPSVAPEGKRIAYDAGDATTDVIEISLLDGWVLGDLTGGETNAWWPDWAPSGTHFLFSAYFSGGGQAIQDREGASAGFSRRLVEGLVYQPRWSPDGTRFVFAEVSISTLTVKVMVASASAGHPVALDEFPNEMPGMSWSPDGQWISYLRRRESEQDLAKVRAAPGATPIVLAKSDAVNYRGNFGGTQWSPAGDWILYPAARGLKLISPDGKTTRELTARKFQAYNFSSDGGQVYGIFQNTSGEGALGQLYSVNIGTGVEKLVAPVDLPPSAGRVVGMSIHPDGKRFLTSVMKLPFDIWMLEGFEQPHSRNWLARLLHR